MKVLPDLYLSSPDTITPNAFALPLGLIGFAGYTRAELLHLPDNRPFLWLKLSGPLGTVTFVVIEPGGIIPGYEPDIFDNDAEVLGISDPAEAMILNVVTVKSPTPHQATVNLAGPILVNRRTGIGRQVVIANYSRYSARQVLVHAEEAACATA
jgi:flagellar assembly factor FliW